MKISNSPIPNNTADVYRSTMKLEKVHEAIKEIEHFHTKQPHDSADTIFLSDQAKNSWKRSKWLQLSPIS